MIENSIGFLIDENLSEQTVHLLETTNSCEQDYVNVEKHVLEEAVYPLAREITATSVMADAEFNQEYNCFQYESHTAQRSGEQSIESTSLLNENSNSLMHSAELYDRNPCVSAIKNTSNVSSSNDINIVRMFRNGEFLSEYTLAPNASLDSTTTTIRTALEHQQQSFDINGQFNQTYDDLPCQAMSSLLSNKETKKPDDHLTSEEPGRKEEYTFKRNSENKTISLDQLCAETNKDEITINTRL